MPYRPIQRPPDLPKLGQSEDECLDFKRKHDSDPIECAKDVAAMANYLGGVILIGAGERPKDILSEYVPMPLAEAQRAIRDYEDAIRERCSPRPRIMALPIQHREGDTYVVAINVIPEPFHPIGVRLSDLFSKRESRKTNSECDDAWWFPVRLSTRTKFLSPEELPMFADPRVRRSVILLSRISEGADVFLRSVVAGVPKQEGRAIFGAVVADDNAVIFTQALPIDRRPTFSMPGDRHAFPLDCVATVYKDARGEAWHVTISVP